MSDDPYEKPTSPPAGQTWEDGEWVWEESYTSESIWTDAGWYWHRKNAGCAIWFAIGLTGLGGLIGGTVLMFA